MKILIDTLQNKGKYSRKSVTAFASFLFSIIYEFVLPWFGFETKEYVFISLITLVGGTLGLTVLDKKNTTTEN